MADDWLDADDPLTDEEKALLEARLAEIEQHPEKSIPWEEVKKRLGHQHTAAWLTPVLQGVTIGMLIVFAIWVWHVQ